MKIRQKKDQKQIHTIRITYGQSGIKTLFNPFRIYFSKLKIHTERENNFKKKECRKNMRTIILEFEEEDEKIELTTWGNLKKKNQHHG